MACRVRMNLGPLREKSAKTVACMAESAAAFGKKKCQMRGIFYERYMQCMGALAALVARPLTVSISCERQRKRVVNHRGKRRR